MQMALFDECPIGRGQDVVVIDAGERLSLDGLPIPLAVAGAIETNDGFRRNAGADPDRAGSSF